MTMITDIMIPFASLAGIVGLVWGAATLVRGHRAVDDVNKMKIESHEVECKTDRGDLTNKVNALQTRVSVLEDRDKR